MHKIVLVVTVLLFLCLSQLNGDALSPGNGFGDQYDWVPFDKAGELAKKIEKPIMLIIHKSWCGACKRLKPIIADSDILEDAFKEFVVVNVVDDEEPEDDQFKPDGGYIPRVLFLDYNDNKVMPEFKNKAHPDKYNYFYSSDDQLLESMKVVLQEKYNRDVSNLTVDDDDYEDEDDDEDEYDDDDDDDDEYDEDDYDEVEEHLLENDEEEQKDEL